MSMVGLAEWTDSYEGAAVLEDMAQEKREPEKL